MLRGTGGSVKLVLVSEMSSRGTACSRVSVRCDEHQSALLTRREMRYLPRRRGFVTTTERRPSADAEQGGTNGRTIMIEEDEIRLYPFRESSTVWSPINSSRKVMSPLLVQQFQILHLHVSTNHRMATTRTDEGITRFPNQIAFEITTVQSTLAQLERFVCVRRLFSDHR